SRRRHTRSDRDWSSDVCSSDLGDGNSGRDLGVAAPLGYLERRREGRAADATEVDIDDPVRGGAEGLRHARRGLELDGVALTVARSEERRVGKERRARRLPKREK